MYNGMIRQQIQGSKNARWQQQPHDPEAVKGMSANYLEANNCSISYPGEASVFFLHWLYSNYIYHEFELVHAFFFVTCFL